MAVGVRIAALAAALASPVLACETSPAPWDVAAAWRDVGTVLVGRTVEGRGEEGGPWTYAFEVEDALRGEAEGRVEIRWFVAAEAFGESVSDLVPGERMILGLAELDGVRVISSGPCGPTTVARIDEDEDAEAVLKRLEGVSR